MQRIFRGQNLKSVTFTGQKSESTNEPRML